MWGGGGGGGGGGGWRDKHVIDEQTPILCELQYILTQNSYAQCIDASLANCSIKKESRLRSIT